MPADAILTARGFSYSYPEGDGGALHDISFELEPGSFTVLAGVSGCGKSTLLRAACGLVPHFHGGTASGEFAVGGMALRENGPSELSRIVGTVFQEPETQVVMGGVRAELALPLEHRGMPADGVARSVEETALALGIAQLLDRRTDTLSGGELQRVALAAALVHRPQLLVLDEPTSQLDPVAGDELIWLLRRLNEEWGTAVLIAEHRLEKCLGAADRVIALDDGRIVCDDEPHAFLEWATREQCALATPGATLFGLAGLTPPPVSVKHARDALRATGLLPALVNDRGRSSVIHPRRVNERAPSPFMHALRVRGLWYEIKDGPALLRGIDLKIDPGEKVALMGRNGAGKSTLLRHIKGLVEPTRGKIDRAGEIALLLQNPGDYLVHEHAEEEAGRDVALAAGLAGRERANPRDLSGGERQRLALEIVLSGDSRPVVACLDEPTRGMDRGHKDALAKRLNELAGHGTAVLVATHDTDFAASFADRVVLMGTGDIVADGEAGVILSGGWHFSTEVSRILGGFGNALTPKQGAEFLNSELVRR